MAENGLPTGIAAQIEQSADYYPPSTYMGTGGYSVVAASLTHYNEFTFNSDSLADQYIALSAVTQRGRNPKVFAIGVIPPSANVTGNLLDRSASAVNQVADQPDYIGTTGQTSTSAKTRADFVAGLLEYACNPPKGRSEKDPIYQQITEGRDVGKAQASYSSCGDLAHWMLYRLGVRSPYVNRDENKGWKAQVNVSNLAFSPAAKVPNNDTVYKPGDIIVIWSEANGSDGHVIVVKEQTTAGKIQTGEYGQPGGAIKNRTIKESDDGRPIMGNRIVQRYLPLDDVLALAQQNGELADVTLPNEGKVTVESETKWNGKDAAQAREIQEKTANTPLVDVVLERYTAAQKAQILDMQNTLAAIQNVPPLRMLVNPSSFSVKGEKIVADSGWSRNGGTIVEHWGNNQEKISASGKLAGFYAVDSLNAVGPGLTRTAKNFSQSWQNFQSLMAFYANNGGVHLNDPTTNNQERNLSIVGSIYIYYDGILYIGSFDNLSVSESDTTPHTADYSFEFTVRAAFLLDNAVSDSRNYGAVTPSNGTQPVTASLRR
jgi:hypothetical protein